MNCLKTKILDKFCPVILYELIPPEYHDPANMQAYIDCAVDLLTSTPIQIDAVNIPEIHEEDHGDTPRKEVYVPKIDPLEFAHKLAQSSFNHIKAVLNRGTVYAPIHQQRQWLDKILETPDLNSIILIGPSSSTAQYPGPSVLELCDFIQNNYKEKIFCGGITIQTRRHADKTRDEPFRMLTKGLHGIDFFTSQIIYEASSIKLLLKDYAAFCQENHVEPKRVFLSFAPLSTRKDLDFMRWLGVCIPEKIEQELFKADIGIGWRSTRMAMNILQELLVYMHEQQIHVPLGLNIEHITRHNFELSLDFISRLGKIYLDYMAGLSLEK